MITLTLKKQHHGTEEIMWRN